MILAAIAGLAAAANVTADETAWDVAANVAIGTRYFTAGPRWPGQASTGGQVAIAGAAELRWRSTGGDRRASIIPYARWDATDTRRSLFDLREAYWAAEADGIELLVGANTVFWGVTESVHLVDIINQSDGVGDLDGEDKLGQPMISVAMQRDWGLLSLYAMPYFRERTFAGVKGRLRTPLPVDTDNPVYESSAGREHLDFALRYSHYLGNVDMGLSVFKGTSREPRLLPDETAATLVPHYDQIEQLGVDLQYTGDGWLWKLETMVRNGYSDRFVAAVGGFEYTLYQVGGSAADVGLLLEYQYDGRDSREPITLADNDVFAGARLALNDSQNTAVLAGFGYDLETGETYINVEGDRRLGENFVLELRARLFSGAGPGDPTYAIGNDDYLQLTLSRYF